MRSIAVTGTIGSGKSACSQILREMGFPVFDCDQVCHSFLEQDGLLYHRVIDLFGIQIVDDQNHLNRSMIAELIFHDAELKKKYEKMFHDELIRLIQEEKIKHELFFAEVPLLFETGFDQLFDESWLVVCEKQIAIERCMDYRNMKEEDIRLRMKHQMSTEEKIKRADVILDNSTSLESLKNQIIKVLKGMNAYGTSCEDSISD